MTYFQIAKALARHIGVTSFAAADNDSANNQRGFNDQDMEDIRSCIQGALHEIYSLAPSYWVERTVGGVLRPPATIAGDFTQYSTTCTLTGWYSWMNGCTIRVGSDGQDNRLISATELLRPYMGATATGVSATVYADCLAVPAAYNQVIAPVRLAGYLEMSVVGSREEIETWSLMGNISPRDRYSPYRTYNRQIREPRVAFAEFESLGTAAPTLYLRVNPMPGQEYAITFTARLAPPTVTIANIYTSATPTVDPGVSPSLPDTESILLPFALQRWTGHPNFSSSGEQVKEISRQYQVAKTQLLRRRTAQVAHQSAQYLE